MIPLRPINYSSKHANTHAVGGDDPIALGAIGAATPGEIESAYASHLAVQNPHEITAAMIDAFVRTGTNSISLGDSLKIGWGISPSDVWVNYKGIGITAVINTSQAGFTKTPIYYTAMYGCTSHWELTGMTSIYTPRPDSFTVYLTKDRQASVNPSNAVAYGWRIAWLGIQSE